MHIDHESVYRFTGSFRGLRWDVNVQGQRDIIADQGRQLCEANLLKALSVTAA